MPTSQFLVFWLLALDLFGRDRHLRDNLISNHSLLSSVKKCVVRSEEAVSKTEEATRRLEGLVKSFTRASEDRIERKGRQL